MKEEETVEGFYHECAKLLNCAEHVYREFPYRKRTRWNNRGSGNGRFPGNGIIRIYALNNIHVMLRNPMLNRRFNSPEEALAAIKEVLESA